MRGLIEVVLALSLATRVCCSTQQHDASPRDFPLNQPLAMRAEGSGCFDTADAPPVPSPGGDTYGGNGKTFEPIFGAAQSTVIVLHGLSGTDTTMVPLVVFAQLSGMRRSRFIVAQAPIAYVDYRGLREPSWFNMGGLFQEATQYPQDILASICRIERIIHGEQARGVEKVAVVGLSQGGAVATGLLATSNLNISAVVGLSTWFPDSLVQFASQSSVNKALPLLMIHGEVDTVVTREWTDGTLNILRGLGHVVDQQILPGVGHAFGSKIFTAARMAIDYLKEKGI